MSEQNVQPFHLHLDGMELVLCASYLYFSRMPEIHLLFG